VEGAEINFPKNITDIIDRAAVFTENDVDVLLKDKLITISSQSDTGKFKEEANAAYDGEDIKFSITPGLLRDILTETQHCLYNGSVLKFEGENWVYVSSVIARE
jgi:DNA polymerase III sliding clamp (beta) subunit (PCNA family)